MLDGYGSGGSSSHSTLPLMSLDKQWIGFINLLFQK
jgi:hypothetical protein